MGKELIISIVVSVILGTVLLLTVYALVEITKRDSTAKK